MKNEYIEWYIFCQSDKQLLASCFKFENLEGREESEGVGPSMKKVKLPSRSWLISSPCHVGPNGIDAGMDTDQGNGNLLDVLFNEIFKWYENGITCPPKAKFQFPSIISNQSMGNTGDAKDPQERFSVDFWSKAHVIGMLPQPNADIPCISTLSHFSFDLRPLNLFYTNKELYLASLAVHPSHRRQGMGSMTMKVIEHLADVLRCCQIRLHTPLTMIGGMKIEIFYEKKQYTRKRVVFRYYRGTYHAAEMVKLVSS